MNFKKKIIKFSIIQKFLAYVGYLYILFVGATSKIDINSNNTGWLYVFEGTTGGFSESPLVAGKSGLEINNIRPLNLSRVKGMPGYLSISFGTPVRKTLIIKYPLIYYRIKFSSHK